MPFAEFSSPALNAALPTLGNFDFTKKADKSTVKPMVFDFFKKDGKFFNFVFKASVASGSIICSQFDGNANFSMVVNVTDPEDLEFLEKLNSIVAEAIPDQDAWSSTTILKDDNKIFLKLKYSDKKSLALKATSNLDINLKKPMDTKIYQGLDVLVTAQLGFYYNFNDQTYGASLTPMKFVFDIEE